MNFTSDSSKDGAYIFGYEDGWHWSQNGGHYNNGRDFFWVHWEIGEDRPASVKLHVECPRVDVHPALNDIKQKMVRDFLSPTFKGLVESHGYAYKTGSRNKPEHVEKFKCTSPFHVLLREEQRQNDHRATIEMVNREFGETVSEVIDRYRYKIEEALHIESASQISNRPKKIVDSIGDDNIQAAPTTRIAMPAPMSLIADQFAIANPEDRPYALKSLTERQRRLGMLNEPHIAPLVNYMTAVKTEHPGKEMPYFDPCDGGVQAKVLFLLEAPGPQAVGSAFISRNNPDPTARNMCELLHEAGISRVDTVAWNIVPWYVGDGKRIRAVENEDLRQSMPYVEGLLALLPNLKVIGLVGKKAQSARSHIRRFTSVPLVDVHHPSAQNFNSRPYKIGEMREQLKEIVSLINAP